MLTLRWLRAPHGTRDLTDKELRGLTPEKAAEGAERTAGYVPNFVSVAGAMLQAVWTTWRNVMRAGIQSREEELRSGQVQGGLSKEGEPTTEAPRTQTAERQPGNSCSQRAE